MRNSYHVMCSNSDGIRNFDDGIRYASDDFFSNSAYAMRNNAVGMRTGANGILQRPKSLADDDIGMRSR